MATLSKGNILHHKFDVDVPLQIFNFLFIAGFPVEISFHEGLKLVFIKPITFVVLNFSASRFCCCR